MFKSWTLPIIFLLVLAGAVFFIKAREYALETDEPSATTTPIATVKPQKPSPSPTPLGKVLHSVPFVAQAPTGRWGDPKQQDGCEEAVSYMAWLWVAGSEKPKSLEEQEQELLKISGWEQENYGGYHDTSTRDTAERILKGYFNLLKYEVKDDITVQDLKEELYKENVLIVPANGQALGNPYFTAPGPERHMLLIKGYDPAPPAGGPEFITNDNGTRQGENYRYKESVLFNAIRDYPTGYHEPITEVRKAMIIVRRDHPLAD